MLLNARDVIYMNKPDFYQFAIDTFRIKTKTSLYTNKKCTICNFAAKNTTKHFREELMRASAKVRCMKNKAQRYCLNYILRWSLVWLWWQTVKIEERGKIFW